MAKNSIEISEEGGVRFLHFSVEWIQGAMRIGRPNALELAYTREMMVGLLLREPPWPRTALLIGLGAGSMAKYIYHKLPDTKTTVVEIDPQVELIARLHFKLPDDPQRLSVVIGDGAQYMLEDGKKFDAILVDGFDKSGRAGVLDTLPFYQACRSRLSERGVLAVNLLGHSRGFKASTERITDAFDGRALILPPCGSGNTIALASGGDEVDVTLAEMSSRASLLNKATGLNLGPTVQRLKSAATLAQDRLVI